MNKNIKLFSFSLPVVIFFVILIPLFSFAQMPTQPPTGMPTQPASQPTINIGNPFKCTPGTDCTLSGLISAIINKILLPIGGLVAAVMIIYAGFLYVTAGGNETQIKKAHDALLYAVIGAAILLGAWVISEAIREIINQLGGSV